MYCNCGNFVMNKNTTMCASCAQAARKAAKVKVKVVTPVKKVSPQMAKKLAEYNVKRDKHLKDNPDCQIKLIGCQVEGVEVHHCEPRATGLLNAGGFKTTCRHCHNLIHNALSASERRLKQLLI
jgi:hypothetical protein